MKVAKIAVQHFISDITKNSVRSDEIKANNFALEREVVKLRREMDILCRESLLEGSSRVSQAYGADIEG